MQAAVSDARSQDLSTIKKCAPQIMMRAICAMDAVNTSALNFKDKASLGLVHPITARFLVSDRYYNKVKHSYSE